MAKVVLIACVSQKREHSAPARDLYISSLFTKAYHYAQTLQPDAPYILSAEHGLVHENTILEPYNKAMHSLTRTERIAWAEQVLAALRTKHNLATDQFVFLAGKLYRRGLAPHMTHSIAPMEGLGIGRQLAWLTWNA